MILRALLHAGWTGLRRDRSALLLTFLLPIVFFSIFAMVFGDGGGKGKTGPAARTLTVLAVDEDRSELSQRFLKALGDVDTLELEPVHTDAQDASAAPPRETARLAVRSGRAPVAVVVPHGFAERFGRFGPGGAEVEVLYDPANPIAANALQGMIQAAAMQAAPDVLMTRGLAQLEAAGIALTPDQQRLTHRIAEALRGERPWDRVRDEDGAGTATPRAADDAAAGQDADASPAGLIRVAATDVRSLDPGFKEQAALESGRNPPRGSMLAYYAAGMAAMFLLFSCAGAGGSLLEEEESGTLARMLDLQVPMARILLGKWVFFLSMGVVQVSLMFVYAALAFGLPLFTLQHLAGFALMTLAASAAAAAFGVLLATLSRSRAQLSGLSTILILVMSALGGSMMPRFIMPPFMDTLSRFTFNGWALDGYLKVFWYDDPSLSLARSLLRLTPEVGVLAAMTVLFLLLARKAARRWEVA